MIEQLSIGMKLGVEPQCFSGIEQKYQNLISAEIGIEFLIIFVVLFIY